MTLAVMALNGIGFGLAYLGTRDLWLPSIWHATKNIAVWLLYGESTLQSVPGLGRVTFRGPSSWVGSASHDGIFDLLVTLALIALIIALFRRQLRDVEWVKST